MKILTPILCSLSALMILILATLSIEFSQYISKSSAEYYPNSEISTCKEITWGKNGGFPLWDKEAFDEEIPSAEDDSHFDVNEWINIVRNTTEKYGCYGDCDFNAIYNVIKIAEIKLWTKVMDERSGETYRAPCGGKAMCHKPYLTDNVSCYV